MIHLLLVREDMLFKAGLDGGPGVEMTCAEAYKICKMTNGKLHTRWFGTVVWILH